MAVLGLDIGGANLKAAHSGGKAWSRPFAVWREPRGLPRALALLVADAPAFDVVAVTMTAELCDCFEDKAAGVGAVLDAVATVDAEAQTGVWSTASRFLSLEQARADPGAVAAANWHALATWVGRLLPTGTSLLIDTGSTTTDIVLIRDGTPAPAGLTDTQRLASGELVYSGLTRTPLMALGPGVEWMGKRYGLMAEHFASTADVYVLLGSLKPEAQRTDTPDGRALTREACAARVARMIGADRHSMTQEQAVTLAGAFARRQRALIADAARRVIGTALPDRVVVSGAGAAIASAAAELLGAEAGRERVLMANRIGTAAAASACAVALVHLWGA